MKTLINNSLFDEKKWGISIIKDASKDTYSFKSDTIEMDLQFSKPIELILKDDNDNVILEKTFEDYKINMQIDQYRTYTTIVLTDYKDTI